MLIHYFLKYKFRISLYMAMTIASTISYAMLVLNVGPIFDAARVGKIDTVLRLFTILFFGFLGIRLLDYYAEAVSIIVINKIRECIKQELFKANLKKGIENFSKKSNGSYISDLTNDITVLENKGLISAKNLFSDVITIFTASAAILTINAGMAVFIIAGVAVCVVIPVMTKKRTSDKMMCFLTAFDAYVQHLKDYFVAFFTIKNYSAENSFIDKFRDENKQTEDKKFEAELHIEFINALIGRIAFMIETAVMIVGVIAVINRQMEIGAVISAFILAGDIGLPLQNLIGEYNRICSVKGIEDKIAAAKKDLAEQTPELEMQMPERPDIEFVNTSLKIGEKEILKGIDLKLKFGEKYLIVGSNGSGKSSLMTLLKQNCSNWEGAVIIGGIDVRSWDNELLCRAVSYSNENVALISDTIEKNITLYREASADRINDCIKQARLDVPVERFVGDGGKYLSSGERRKVEIARALLTDPSVMIFDEVISTLDIETAFEIEKLILSMDGRTVIMVSNAFSGHLLECYDRIILMNNGHITAEGSYESMMKTSSEFREMVTLRCGVREEI